MLLSAFVLRSSRLCFPQYRSAQTFHRPTFSTASSSPQHDATVTTSPSPSGGGRSPSSSSSTSPSLSPAVPLDPLVSHAKEPAQPEDPLSGVTIVNDRKTAARVVLQLMQLSQRNPVAWDTETTGVNPAKQSPVYNGSVICATAYAGDHVDFGNGPRLFVDCLDGENGLLDVFKPYFESNDYLKVWHHYAFDRHILRNHQITTKGFAGDTMHMARLVNSTHTRYSLDELCRKYLNSQKRSMMQRFGKPEKLMNGSDGKKICVPSTIDLHRMDEHRNSWIEYATADAELTHRLYFTLNNYLQNMNIHGENSTVFLTTKFPNLQALYREVMIPFGELLTDMERYGFKVDTEFLKQAEIQADNDRVKLENEFIRWAVKVSPDANYMNINSDQQKLQLFFAPCKNSVDKSVELETSKTFSLELVGKQRDDYLKELSESDDEQDKQKYKKLTKELDEGKKRRVKRDIVISGLGKKPRGLTEGGWPSVSAKSLRSLAGYPRANPPYFGEPDDKPMCLAIDDMIEANTISTLLSTFIIPLQQWPGEDGRIHASLNLNTETGRLSSRRPNLQNQPALEKDRYKVRKAFICEKGNRLIVADYGQLELRLLAHITGCKSMIEAFRAGGDFHSRTALTMFDYIQQAIDDGKCVLERDQAVVSDDENKKIPLVKEMFSVERRKAKTLNFSIAYGKTVMGLSRDWGVSEAEARETLQLWYKERKEVENWQKRCKAFLREKGYVETLFGRRRHLPEIEDRRKMAHAQRAAINAPLQGSAADLVMAAMVKLHQSRLLNVLGWKTVLQVHDEIILEGPEESADSALVEVEKIMKRPMDMDLNVELTVDAKIAQSWYDAK